MTGVQLDFLRGIVRPRDDGTACGARFAPPGGTVGRDPPAAKLDVRRSEDHEHHKRCAGAPSTIQAVTQTAAQGITLHGERHLTTATPASLHDVFLPRGRFARRSDHTRFRHAGARAAALTGSHWPRRTSSLPDRNSDQRCNVGRRRRRADICRVGCALTCSERQRIRRRHRPNVWGLMPFLRDPHQNAGRKTARCSLLIPERLIPSLCIEVGWRTFIG